MIDKFLFLFVLLYFVLIPNAGALWERFERTSIVDEEESIITEAYLEQDGFFDRTFVTIGCSCSYPKPSILIKFPSLTTDLFRRDLDAYVAFYTDTNVDLLQERSYMEFLAIKDDPNMLSNLLEEKVEPVIVIDSLGKAHKVTALDFMISAGLVDQKLNYKVADNQANDADPRNSNNPNFSQTLVSDDYLILKAKVLEADEVLLQVGNDWQSEVISKLYNMLTTHDYVYMHFRQGKRSFSEKLDLTGFNEVYKDVLVSCKNLAH